MRDYEQAHVVIMSRNGFFKIAKCRLNHHEVGEYVMESVVVRLLNSEFLVGICNEAGRIIEKNFELKREIV